ASPIPVPMPSSACWPGWAASGNWCCPSAPFLPGCATAATAGWRATATACSAGMTPASCPMWRCGRDSWTELSAAFQHLQILALPAMDVELLQMLHHRPPALDAFGARHVRGLGNGIGHAIQIVWIDQQRLLQLIGGTGQQ